MATTIDLRDTQSFTWEQELASRLPLFGHRNWIVVADSAYPAQSKPGIETIVAGGDHVEAVKRVLEQIGASTHVRANVYVDSELDHVPENDAPGIGECRRRLHALLTAANLKQLAHEQIIAKLDACAQVFRVLIIKTDLALPYTSVFFELDCGYWSAEAEQRLRKAIQQS
ncbi:MAG TPA: RbsD/FucU domain-containing protein [Terracidiphilus sp.]|nr:RbsD/FucU domain-containing protein [Terracidiphilus sp.]